MLRLQVFRAEQKEEGAAALGPGDTETLTPISEFAAKPYTKEEERSLFEIIRAFNDRHGTAFTHCIRVALRAQKYLRPEGAKVFRLFGHDRTSFVVPRIPRMAGGRQEGAIQMNVVKVWLPFPGSALGISTRLMPGYWAAIRYNLWNRGLRSISGIASLISSRISRSVCRC